MLGPSFELEGFGQRARELRMVGTADDTPHGNTFDPKLSVSVRPTGSDRQLVDQ